MPAHLERSRTAAPLILCALTLAACATQGPREARPAPRGAIAATQAFDAPVTAWPTEAWWTAYADPQLDQLIGEALQDSPTLATAQARLRRAQAQAGIAGAPRLPRVDANAAAAEQKQSERLGVPVTDATDGWNDAGRASIDLSWELDFWGRNRAAFAAATSEAEAARADAAQARLALSASIASSYAELARLYAARDTAQSALDVRAKTADLFADRFANGLETQGSVRQVQSRRASAAGDVLTLDEQTALAKNRIAALVGAGPDRASTITRPVVNLSRAFGLPSALAADLLGRRPDLTAARLRAEAASHRIHQAEAAFYPNVNLSAFIGVQSLGLNALAKSGSSIGSVGPAISLPLFDGGRLRGQLRAADADYAQAVASYDATLLQALQDVADAVTSTRALGGELARATEAVEAARDAWRIQNDRYRGGLSSYLDVLSAEDGLLAAQRTESDLRARAFVLDVALVRALGGGYAAPAPTT